MSSSPCRHEPHKNFTYAVSTSPQPEGACSATGQDDLQKLQQELDCTRPANQFNREVAAEIELLCRLFEIHGILDGSQYSFRGIAEAVVRERWIGKGIWASDGPYPDSRSEWSHSQVELGSGYHDKDASRPDSRFQQDLDEENWRIEKWCNQELDVPPENAARRARENLESLGFWTSKCSEGFEKYLAEARQIFWSQNFYVDRNTAYENCRARWTQWGYWDPIWTELPGKDWRHEREDENTRLRPSTVWADEKTLSQSECNTLDSMISSGFTPIPNLPQEQSDWSFLPHFSDRTKRYSNRSNVHHSLASSGFSSKEETIRAQLSSKSRQSSSPQRDGDRQYRAVQEHSKSAETRKRNRGSNARCMVRRSARIAARSQQPRECTAAMFVRPEIYQARVVRKTAKSGQIGTSLTRKYLRTRSLTPTAPPYVQKFQSYFSLNPPPPKMVWPHRLLHVPSMTSFSRHGFDIYNNVTAPSYNIISYTWGNFVEAGSTSILVKGIDWPVPPIKSEHFTAASFQVAIERAARGVKYRCDWLWVDVACIPQWHQNETAEAKRLRGQEINSQEPNLSPFVTTFDIDVKCDLSSYDLHHTYSANEYLKSYDQVTAALDSWTRILLAHPYFSSLWTLQEMTLREDAWILLDDGVPHGWESLEKLGFEIDSALTYVQSREIFMLRAEKTVRVGNLMPECTFEELRDRLNRLESLQECKGLVTYRMRVPHRAYSLAQHRNASRFIDRIYGIVQTYDISCNPDPDGETEAAKLRTLEDEFGMKLVAKFGFISQLFIHSSPPRRSWLITPKCTVSSRWKVFSSRNYTEERASLVVSEQSKNLEFCGRAWHLVSLLDSIPVKEQAMMLDDHVANEVLGQIVDHFKDHKSMHEAGERLFKRFGRSVRVALLASVKVDHSEEFVGLLVAPLGEFEESPPWVRIGLFWWKEESRLTHRDIPNPHHSFECLIK